MIEIWMKFVPQVLLYFASEHNCTEMFSWLIEIWMKTHLLSDINYNIVNPQFQKKCLQETTLMLGLHAMLVTLSGWCRIEFRKANIIGECDTLYRIFNVAYIVE
jgi:hypothetical protein